MNLSGITAYITIRCGGIVKVHF